MDINVFRGIMSGVLMFAFLGIVFWAYSKSQKKTFEEAANLPFEDEHEDKPDLGTSSSLENKKHD
ncbi:cbb3-type cytochrome c oxidase subunit 3 [Marinospirillum sp. MEB164]|uniref:Cbb3-type cytochrome c oxidase subunit 3 n=1 Tax=Marinospirillum alkalitolerans TaxID=3123374 RepID=A0ABW8PVA5_9GAMM